MGLLDGLEKLINEHGSAVILKERIQLANDRYAALERKASELEGENGRLKDENKRLREQARAAEAMVVERSGARLDDLGEKVLVLVSKQGEVPRDHVAAALKINAELAEYHLNELTEADLLRPSYSYGSPTEWSLAQEGRRYLVKHGLLK